MTHEAAYLRAGQARLARFLRLGLVALFMAAGVPKILDPPAFAQAIDGFQLLPPVAIPAMAIILPWLEVLLAAALLCRVWLYATLVLTNLLLALFLGAVISAVWRGLDVTCGCFGATDSVPTQMWIYVGRDTLFLLAGLTLARLHSRSSPNKNSLPHSTTPCP